MCSILDVCIWDSCDKNMFVRQEAVRYMQWSLGKQSIQFQFSCSVVSNSLRSRGVQHARLPCPSPTRRSAFFTVQLSHPYMTTGKTIALTRRTLVSKVMSLILNILSRLVITFLSRRKCLLVGFWKFLYPVKKGPLISILLEVLSPKLVLHFFFQRFLHIYWYNHVVFL